MKKVEQAFFIIKPEGTPFRTKIKEYITNSGLILVRSDPMILNEQDIVSIYLDDIGSRLMAATYSHLLGREIEAGIIEGEDAIERFWNICGDKPDNLMCKEGTIRRDFGMEPLEYDGVTYFQNCIHKASKKEARAAIKWFYRKINSN